VELLITGVEVVAKMGLELGVVAGEESLAVGVGRLSIGGKVGLVVANKSKRTTTIGMKVRG